MKNSQNSQTVVVVAVVTVKITKSSGGDSKGGVGESAGGDSGNRLTVVSVTVW